MNMRPRMKNRIKGIRSVPLRTVTYAAAVPVAALAIAGSFWLYGSGAVEVPSGQVEMAALANEPSPAPQPEPEPAAPVVNSADKAERPVQEVAETELGLTPLEADDPRWRSAVTARDAEEESLGGRFRPTPADAEPTEAASGATNGADAAGTELTAISEDGTATTRNAAPAGTETAIDAMTTGMPPTVDTETTAAIGRPDPELSPDVQVAETEVEIAALEAAVAEAQAGRPDAAFVSEGIEMVPGRIKSYVNLRAGPSNDAEVLTIVPTDKRIEAQPLEQCVHFCQVIVDGQRGFIGKTFIAFDEPRETAETE